jgi:hypothetical protein
MTKHTKYGLGDEHVAVLINGKNEVRGWGDTTVDAALGALYALAREYARVVVEHEECSRRIERAEQGKRDAEFRANNAEETARREERAAWLTLIGQKVERKRKRTAAKTKKR